MRGPLYKTFIRKPIEIDHLDIPILRKNRLLADVLRLDKIHPIVSGNKEFKLKHYLIDALSTGAESVLTWGGAYSNHLVATAFAARENGLASLGIVRGERPSRPSHTLQTAMNYGMDLHFTSRGEFGRKTESETFLSLRKKFPGARIIPEGGAGLEGIRGSEEILDDPRLSDYSHILCAVGTATMFIGLANASRRNQIVMGFPVLRLANDLLIQCTEKIDDRDKWENMQMIQGYHFGGYAKKNNTLIDFMNSFYILSSIPLDFVYTAKLFYGFMDLVQKNYFPEKSKLLLIHSGGLQGNASIPKGTLVY
ncbi:MAG: 1-aminocyclopropane-1-carboxylate deaminase/D-cysteine desulfhydrase [Chitinophagales bacterium]